MACPKFLHYILLLVFVCSVSVSHASSANPPVHNPEKEKKKNKGAIHSASALSTKFSIPAGIPVYFLKNTGEFKEEALYFLKSPALNLILKKNAVTYQFYSKKHSSKTDSRFKVENIELKFINSQPDVEIFPSDTLLSQTNYFIGNNPANWKNDLPNYSSIRYRNLYHNTDLVYYSTKNHVKYDFILHPGANLDDIEMDWEGAQNIWLGKDGKLCIKTRAGIIIEDIPLAWQDINGIRSPVKVDYSITGKRKVKFICPAYNPQYELVIDPSLNYLTYLGGECE